VGPAGRYVVAKIRELKEQLKAVLKPIDEILALTEKEGRDLLPEDARRSKAGSKRRPS
jgi:hypothetical protein